MRFIEMLEQRTLLADLPLVWLRRPPTPASESGAIRAFTVTREGDVSRPLVVNLLVGGKARNGIDYGRFGATAKFPAGAATLRLKVRPVDDALVEGTESVTLTLASSPLYRIDADTMTRTIRIRDNDLPPLPTKLNWTNLATSPVPRGEAERAVIDGRIYVFGGYTDFSATNARRSDVYDPATNTWSRIADMPIGVSHAGAAVVGRDVYLAGGYTGGPGGQQTFATRQVQRYNADANSWSTIAPLPEARGGGALVAVGDVLHFFGGSDIQRHDRGEHWAFDLANPAAGWIAKASLPTPRTHMGAINLNGIIYAVGGQQHQDAAENPQSAVEAYDPSTDSWLQRAPLPFGRSHIAGATVTANGRIVTLGGETTYQTSIDNVTAYDQRTDTWQELSPLPAKRASGVAAFIDGVFYYSGGGVTSKNWRGAGA